MEYFTKLFKSIEIVRMANGPLLGIQYFPLDDRMEAFADEDWAELNIYLLIICVRFKW